MTNNSHSDTGSPYSTKARWAIIGLLAIASIIAYIDRVNLSVALADTDFQNFFGLTNTDRGLVNSAFFWTYAALQIPAGWVVDRYGSKYPIAAAFAVWSILTALTAFTTGFASLFAIRMALGVGEALIHPACMRWIRFNFDEKNRGLAIGLFMSGSKFGPAIGAVAAAWLIESYGWQEMFLVLGLGSLLWLIPWLLFVKKDRHTGSSGQSAAAAALAESEDVPIGRVLRSPVLWGTIIGTFCYMYFVYFCMTWLPVYFAEERGMTLKTSALYTTFSFAGMAIMSIIGGFAADRLIRGGRDAVKVRKSFTIAGFLVATTVLVGAFTESDDVALFFSVVSLSGLGLATANYWALTQSLIPGGAIGRIVGIQNCAASGAGVVAPILTGLMVDVTGSFDAPLKTVAVFIAIGIASYVFLVRKEYAPVAVQI